MTALPQHPWLFTIAFAVAAQSLPSSTLAQVINKKRVEARSKASETKTGNESIGQFSMADFSRVPKIDIHTHLHANNIDFLSLAKRDQFRMLTMSVWTDPNREKNLARFRLMFQQFKAAPDRLAVVGSFSANDSHRAEFVDETIAQIDELFDQGAVGIKVWKNIGMEIRDPDGQIVMIDDPRFDEVFEHIRKRDRVLLGHLGEPKNCWLPLNEMTTNNDRSYFADNPQYHMYRHPELPSYEDQMAARDRMLAKHPKLKFLACHLASLSWSVDRIGAFLERFPNARVEVAARMGQIQHQSQRDPQDVYDFFVKYQDRILYGTDSSIRPNDNAVETYERVRARWLRDWMYFNTNQSFDVPELDDPVIGIGLPKQVVEKIYRINARKLFPTSWPEPK